MSSTKNAPSANRARFTIIAVVFVLGLMVGQYTNNFLPGAPKSYNDFTDLTQGYHFIDPLLFCSDREMTGQTAEYSQRLENELTDLIEEHKKLGLISEASVLYRDLSNGPRVSVNGELGSAPASLLKVPLALSIHRRVESDPSFLQRKVMMNMPDQNAGEYFMAPKKAEFGVEYTIDELLDLSLINSDNNATDLLISQLTDEELRKSYVDLGIKVPIDNPNAYTMNVAVYSSFFRILYNSSYLSRENSERFLANLSKSTFTQGLVAGVPPGTTVSHKFGEYSAGDGFKQLHDCGIVYKAKQPYLLCVMTQGDDFEKLAKTIQNISRKVWDLDE